VTRATNRKHQLKLPGQPSSFSPKWKITRGIDHFGGVVNQSRQVKSLGKSDLNHWLKKHWKVAEQRFVSVGDTGG
jgi:hypothetical protein